MPAKRKSTRRQSAAPPKKRTPPPPQQDDYLTQTLQLWKSVMHAPSRFEQQRALYRATEDSALRRFVWPLLLENESQHQQQASLLLAALVSWEHREGVTLDTALRFVEEDPAVWNTVCQNLVDTLHSAKSEEGPLSYARWAAVTHFFTIASAVAQQGESTSNSSSSSTSTIVRPVVQEQLSTWEIWLYMPARARELLLRQQPDVQLPKKKKKTPPFIVTVVQEALHLMEGDCLKLHAASIANQEEQEQDHYDEWNFLHRALELLIDLLSCNEPRRILAPYLDALHFSVRARLALGVSTASHAQTDMLLAQQLLERLDAVLHWAVDPVKGEHESYVDVRTRYHARAAILQKMCHRHYAEELPDVIYAGVGVLCQATFLRQALGGLSDAQLLDLLHRMRLVDKSEESTSALYQREFLLQVLQNYLVIPNDPLQVLQHFALYPTEQVLWDFHRIPPSHPSRPVLDLPKLQMRFLSFADYLGRNFELMRLESAYEIRSDLCDVVRRVKPVVRQLHQDDDDDDTGNKSLLRTEFTGWARMALEGSVDIKKVSKPSLGGGLYPSQVLAEVSIDLSRCGAAICREWDELGEFDNIFLLTVDAAQMTGRQAPLMSELNNRHSNNNKNKGTDRRVSDQDDPTFPQRFGVKYVRGAMILHVRDEKGTILSDPTTAEKPQGQKRIFLVALDPTQYATDAKSPGTEMYESINLVVRRHGRENNFKAVLETIRGLMSGTGSINRVIPPFLQKVILGQGEPDAAHYKSDTVKAHAASTVGVAGPDSWLDYGDTFLDEEHLKACFPDAKFEMEGEEMADTVRRYNYRLQVTESKKGSLIKAQAYPFPPDIRGNPVRFTARQVEAIRSGLSPGLSMVVGPPGTGKTDVAVQIITSLYHSFPNQRTVVITHSNAALNDIFEKVVSRGDVEEGSLLRLGSGERTLQTDSTHDFTKTGRVAYCLEQRGMLLEKVQRMSESLGLSGRAERGADGSPGYTCETAEYFRIHHFKKLARTFEQKTKDENIGDEDHVESAVFPFSAYFGKDGKLKVSEARNSINEMEDVFDRLELYRPFELLRSQRQRTDYLLMKQTRVVAMTCTHAAIARSHLIKLGFEYDNVVVEEAGQMVEIESFIPLLLQQGDADGVSSSSSRLKRVCLMGDHNQLPPVIKNMAFAKYSSLDQSLFTRLIRLGVPHTQLDKQGRARAEIAQLYSWRYNNLGNLDHVTNSKKFQLANPGFAHNMQLVNIEEFEGNGETSPSAYFYQNTGEAEYVVALFQYMVLIGHSPQSISILTTYNGQKQLIEDILNQRCGEGTPLAGVKPRAVSTVDQYQGQQNDFILLSLVRTESVGHLRDVRRLVVAVSRARQGLYVFCRQSLFSGVHELKQTFDQLVEKPTKLQLVLGENYPSDRKVSDEVDQEKILEIDDVSHLGLIVHKMQEDLMKQDA